MDQELKERLKQGIRETCADRNYELGHLLEDAMNELEKMPEATAHELSPEPKDTLILSTEHSPLLYMAVWLSDDKTKHQVCLEGAGRFTKTEAKAICREQRGTVAISEDQAKVLGLPYTVVDYGQIQEVIEKLGLKHGVCR